MTPAETLAKSKQLDSFLGKAVKEIKTMNKFAELAAKVKADQESMYAEVEDLSVESDKTMSQFKESVSRYRAVLDDAKEGIKAMNEVAAAMAGNGSPLPDSPPSSPPLPPVIEQPAPAPIVMPVAVEASTVEPERVVDLIPEPVAPPPIPVMDPTATGNPPA